LLKGLPSETLISLLPGFLQVVYNKGTIRKYIKGEILHQEGDKVESLYIPIDGDIVLFNKDKNEAFGFLEKGRSFALSSLLHDTPVNYSARFDASARVIEIKKEDFFEFLKQHPDHHKYLEIISTSQAARNFRRFLSEYNLQPDKLITIISQLEEVRSVTPGSLNDTLKKNILLFNDGEIHIKFPNREYLSKKLTEGAWMGGEAMVPPSTLSYLIASCTSKSVLKISHEILMYAIESELILEKLYNEPFINLMSISDDYYLDFKSKKIEVSDVNRELFKQNFQKVSAESLLKSSSDFESLIVGTINVCLLLGRQYNYSLIEAHFHRNRLKLSTMSISNILDQMGMSARSFKGDYEKAEVPFVAFVSSRLLVVYAHDKEYLYFHDSGYGYGKLKKNDPILKDTEWVEVVSYEKADLLEDEQSEILDKYKIEKKQTQSRMYSKNLIFRKKKLLLQVGILSLVAFLIGLATPYISGKIVDEVIALKDLQSLYAYGLGLFLAYAFLTYISYLKGRLLSEFSYLFDYSFSVIFYKKLLDLKQKFFDKINVGYVFARLTELNAVREFFSSTTLETFISMITGAIYSVILFTYGWKIAIVPLIMFAVVFLLQYFFKKHIRKVHLRLFEANSKTNSLVSETISSMTTIKAFKAEKYFSEKMDFWFLNSINLTKDMSKAQTTFQSLMSFIIKCMPIIVVWVAILEAFEGKMSMGEVYAAVMYLGRVTGPLNQIVNFFVSLEELKVSFQKLDDVFEEEPEENIKSKLSSMSVELKGLIRFDRVKFKYDDEGPWILDDVSFSIFPKQRVALVGESGCGKTTLANLIAGNHQPTQGRILYDGMDQTYISLDSLRSQIGFIQQDNRLFAGTIASNITFARDFINPEKMHEVSRRAYCDEFINVFPTGYNQFLSEGGMGLSGGQKQRLCIARVLYQDPKILIMDEATSALDSDSESKIIQTLREYMMDRTSIIIAHRYSTIRNCDYIIVMDNGKIVEVGTHEELIHKEGGKFFDLFKSQIVT